MFDMQIDLNVELGPEDQLARVGHQFEQVGPELGDYHMNGSI